VHTLHTLLHLRGQREWGSTWCRKRKEKATLAATATVSDRQKFGRGKEKKRKEKTTLAVTATV